MKNREHNIFSLRIVWLIVIASVLDVLMWTAFDNDYRANLLFNKSYPSSVEFVIDLSITLFESGFLIITGSLAGESHCKTFVRIREIRSATGHYSGIYPSLPAVCRHFVPLFRGIRLLWVSGIYLIGTYFGRSVLPVHPDNDFR